MKELLLIVVALWVLPMISYAVIWVWSNIFTGGAIAQEQLADWKAHRERKRNAGGR